MEASATITTERPRRTRGLKRMLEIAAESSAERKIEEGRLFADLGRAPNAVEKLLIEQSAGLAVRARRLRALGREREAADVTRLLVRTLGRLAKGAKSAPTVGLSSADSPPSVAMQSGGSPAPVAALSE